METKQPFLKGTSANPYYLGEYNGTAWYFYYEPQKVTALNYEFLFSLTDAAENKVIYADRCSISDERLGEMGIVFKKIPRDIARL